MVEIKPRRQGKSWAMRLAIDAVLERGGKVAIHCLTPDGNPHVCTVLPFSRRLR